MPRPRFYDYLCTNKHCPDGRPNFKCRGKRSRRRCPICGNQLRRIPCQPRSTSR